MPFSLSSVSVYALKRCQTPLVASLATAAVNLPSPPLNHAALSPSLSSMSTCSAAFFSERVGNSAYTQVASNLVPPRLPGVYSQGDDASESMRRWEQPSSRVRDGRPGPENCGGPPCSASCLAPRVAVPAGRVPSPTTAAAAAVVAALTASSSSCHSHSHSNSHSHYPRELLGLSSSALTKHSPTSSDAKSAASPWPSPSFREFSSTPALCIAASSATSSPSSGKSLPFSMHGAVYLYLVRPAPDGSGRQELLLARRANTGFMDGKLCLVGGHLDGGETVRQAMQREAAEEIGIKVEEDDLEVLCCMHRPSVGRGRRREYFDVAVRASRWSGTVVNNEPQKCSGVGFYPIDDLPEDVAPYIRHLIDCCESGISFTEFGFDEDGDGGSGDEGDGSKR